MINGAAEEAVAVVEDVALRRLVIDDPTVAEPLGFAVRRGLDEQNDAAARRDGVVGEAGLEERLEWIAMVVAVNAIELVLDRSLKLNVVADAVAAAVALGLARVGAGVFFLIGTLDHQFASAIGQFLRLVFVARDDVVAVLHPLDVRLRRSTDSTLQCQHIVMQIVAL